jgi:hypothetical protein
MSHKITKEDLESGRNGAIYRLNTNNFKDQIIWVDASKIVDSG